MSELATFIYPIIRTDYIEKSLKSLFKYTDRSKFNLIVVDQSIEGMKLRDPQYNELYIRMKNVGFSKAANEGIVHALKWETPYICIVNDDTEFMYRGWFEDALKEFDTDPNIVAVCPESPRIAGWGYGLEHGACIEILPHKEEYTPEDIAYLKRGDYNKEEMQSRHTEFKIPETFPFTKRGVIDGIAMWCPIFKREAFIRLGLFEEKFIWGGGEDYDMLCRAYSCAYPVARDECEGDGSPNHLRMVSTMKSWIWHWWGQSKDVKASLDPKLFEGKTPWNSNTELWGPKFDVWGHYDDNGVKRPLKRLLPVTTK